MYIAETKLKETVDDAYIRLAIGIVKQACVDYARAYRASLEQGKPTDALLKLERWFRSGWGLTLTFGEGELVLEYVRKNIKRILKREKRVKKGEELDYGKW